MLIIKKDHCIKEMEVRIPEYEAEETRGAQETGGRTSTKLIVWKKKPENEHGMQSEKIKIISWVRILWVHDALQRNLL